ncbi:hypothetical protein WJX73_001883 [Symbiochloris irregularis]|uniref:Uncharacterized protein n=1 Tax=Symbiochloris irregularis TaxID=706552 RepID=A0AAW1P1H7_9CHLO
MPSFPLRHSLPGKQGCPVQLYAPWSRCRRFRHTFCQAIGAVKESTVIKDAPFARSPKGRRPLLRDACPELPTLNKEKTPDQVG